MAGDLFTNGSRPSTVDVRAFFDSRVPDAIAGLVEMGVLVAVGTTRDRGALSITITHDGAFDREYFRNSEDALEYLGRATETLGARIGGVKPQPQTTVQRTRKRLS